MLKVVYNGIVTILTGGIIIMKMVMSLNIMPKETKMDSYLGHGRWLSSQIAGSAKSDPIVHPNHDFCNRVEGEGERPDLVESSRGISVCDRLPISQVESSSEGSPGRWTPRPISGWVVIRVGGRGPTPSRGRSGSASRLLWASTATVVWARAPIRDGCLD